VPRPAESIARSAEVGRVERLQRREAGLDLGVREAGRGAEVAVVEGEAGATILLDLEHITGRVRDGDLDVYRQFGDQLLAGADEHPKTVSYSESETYSSCTSTDTSLTAGSWSGSFTLTSASCNAGGVFPPAAYTISWNNGQSSTIALAFTDVIILGTEQVTGVGTVTSGEFTGGAVTIVWLYPVLNPLLCLTSQGVTSQSGPVVAQIIVVP
jgi:hypothetical protein